MILFFIILALFIVALVSAVIYNWWCDEQLKAGRREVSQLIRNLSPGDYRPLVGPAQALHPSIDPYLTELRAFLLTPPLPQGPGEMAERVYTHLNQWVNEHLTYDAEHTVDVDDELLTGPVQRFVNASYNDPPEYLENEEQ